MTRLAFTIMAVVWAGAATAQEVDCTDAANLTQMDLNQCAAQDYRQWDDLLNVAYQSVILTLDATSEEQLRQAQRAWISYRDLTCQFEADRALGGSIAPLLQFTCLGRLTERRVRDIEEYGRN